MFQLSCRSEPTELWKSKHVGCFWTVFDPLISTCKILMISMNLQIVSGCSRGKIQSSKVHSVFQSLLMPFELASRAANPAHEAFLTEVKSVLEVQNREVVGQNRIKHDQTSKHL